MLPCLVIQLFCWLVASERVLRIGSAPARSVTLVSYPEPYKRMLACVTPYLNLEFHVWIDNPIFGLITPSRDLESKISHISYHRRQIYNRR